jgi:hypothetical protein
LLIKAGFKLRPGSASQDVGDLLCIHLARPDKHIYILGSDLVLQYNKPANLQLSAIGMIVIRECSQGS